LFSSVKNAVANLIEWFRDVWNIIYEPSEDANRILSFGETIDKKFLLQLNMTDDKFAEQIDVDVDEAVDILLDNCSITPELVEKLSKAFGTSTDYWWNVNREWEDQIKKQDLARSEQGATK
jgi:addiction module HigA family antidote